ncbi:MAG: peptidylprolyl isomerase [Candidatus Brocadiaceae bacterium]|nr:peptidylprolyl isomerase [Candidatus Brocadiaceae bacterium]
MKVFIVSIGVMLCNILMMSSFLFGANGKSNNTSFIKAIVEDEIITQDEVIQRAAVAIREAQQIYSQSEFIGKIDEILRNTLEELIDRKVLFIEAQRLMSADELQMEEVKKDVDSFIKSAAKNVGSLSRYYEIAEAQGINPLEKKTELKEDLMIDRIIMQNVNSKVKIQPKLMRRYYYEHIDDYRHEKEVKLRHIMIKFSEHGNDKEQARIIAVKVMKCLRRGDDFAELARQYTEGPNAANGGLWSFEEVSELRKDLRRVVYTLKDNEYSKIVESPIGYHIFKTELIKPEKTQEFEEVQNDIYQKLYREEIVRLKKEYIKDLKAGLFIKVIN